MNRHTSILFYADSPLKVGDIVSLKNPKIDPHLVCKIHLAKSKIPIGLCLNDVINVDNSYASHHYPEPDLPNEVRTGFHFHVLHRGIILQRFSPKLHLPLNQPIYVNLSRSTLTWKALGPMVGRTDSYQDQDGYVKVEVDF